MQLCLLLCYYVFVQPFVQVGLLADSQAVRSLACKTVRGYTVYLFKSVFSMDNGVPLPPPLPIKRQTFYV